MSHHIAFAAQPVVARPGFQQRQLVNCVFSPPGPGAIAAQNLFMGSISVKIQPTRLSADLTTLAIPAFDDNYLWLVKDGHGNAIAIDPGDDAAVQATLDNLQLRLHAILITHHHHDHIGGIAALVQRHHCPVYGPDDPRIPLVSRICADGDEVVLSAPNLRFKVIQVPGHTRSHIAYIGHDAAFVGDTLFSAGCGRLFEGTAAQMLQSLDRLTELPAETIVFCAHEYTRDNLRFALDWEPENTLLQQRYAEVSALCARGIGSLPTTIAAELGFNPFLRCDQPLIRARLAASLMRPVTDRLAAFAELRALKNVYVARH
jgi:hydroxyacylglutathione hydrolase